MHSLRSLKITKVGSSEYGRPLLGFSDVFRKNKFSDDISALKANSDIDCEPTFSVSHVCHLQNRKTENETKKKKEGRANRKKSKTNIGCGNKLF